MVASLFMCHSWTLPKWAYPRIGIKERIVLLDTIQRAENYGCIAIASYCKMLKFKIRLLRTGVPYETKIRELTRDQEHFAIGLIGSVNDISQKMNINTKKTGEHSPGPTGFICCLKGL